MKNNLLNSLLTILFFAFSITAFSQDESETDDAQSFNNPAYSPVVEYSVFDSQPIYGSDWEWLHQQPNGNTLRQVKMWDANNWYAAGFGGTFLKTSDAGATWTVVKSANGLDNNGSNETIYDFHWWDMNTGIIAGTYGTCYKTTDGGLNWDSLSSFPTAATCYDLYFVDDTLGFACGTTSMRIYKTTDGGNTWFDIWGDLPSRTCYQVYAVDENNIRLASSSGYFDYTTNGGVNWSTIDLGGTLYDMTFTDPMNGWACGVDDTPYYTTDGGLTWTATTTSPTASTQYDIDVMATMTYTLNEGFEDATFPPTGWHSKNILGAGEWFRSTGASNTGSASARISWQSTGGEDWLVTPQLNISAGDSLKFWGRKIFSTVYEPDTLEIRVSTTDTSVASFTDVIYKNSVNDAFNTTFDPFSFDLSAYAGMNIYIAFRHYDVDGNGMYLDDVTVGEPTVASQVFVTGDPFNIFSSTDMGTTWSLVNFLGAQPWTSTYYSTDWISPNEFVTVGAQGLINSVNPLDAATAHTLYVKGGTLYSLWAESASGRIIAAGTSTTTTAFDQAFYSTDGGNTWTVSTMEDSSDLDFNGISMVTPLIGYSAGEDYRVMKTTDGGASWFRVTDPVTSTSDAECVFFVDENIGYVFGVLDDGYKTTDGGATWSVLTTGVTATFYRCFFTDANTGWVVGASGTVLHTTDGGATFTPQDPGFTSTIYSIWMVNSNLGYLSGSSGTVRKTTDGGTTWVNVDPASFSSNPALYDIEFKDEDNGMTVGSTGRTFFTNDGGLTWTFENNSMSTIYAVAIETSSADTAAAYVAGTGGYVLKNYHVIVPVELASFSASVNGTEVSLSWITATELNNLGFQIERRSSEEEWLELGFVEGHGTTTESQVYSFVDRDLIPGIYNYRIKQIDYDGSYTYYELHEEVDITAPDSYDLSQNYPNPFNPSTKIKYSVPVEGFVNIAVYNVLGEKVADIVNQIQKAGNYEITFDATRFASGMYIYRMESGNFVSIKKMMILK